MLVMNTYAEFVKVVWGSEPKNYTSATGHSDYVSLKHYGQCAAVIQTGAWAGGTAAVTLTQGTDVAGTGAKALGFSYTWLYASASGTVDTYTKTAVTSNTFDLDTANSLYIIQVRATMLDIDGNFDCFRVSVASPGANTDLYGITLHLYDGIVSAALPSAIID